MISGNFDDLSAWNPVLKILWEDNPPSFYIDILFDIAYAPNYNAFSFCYFLSNKFSEYIIVFIHLNISAWYRKLLTSSSQQLAEWEKASIASHKRCAAVIRKSSS